MSKPMVVRGDQNCPCMSVSNHVAQERRVQYMKTVLFFLLNQSKVNLKAFRMYSVLLTQSFIVLLFGWASAGSLADWKRALGFVVAAVC